MRGAGRESEPGGRAPRLRESPLPHAPLTPTLSPEEGRGSALLMMERLNSHMLVGLHLR
jgi:hypothetical protein